MWASLSNTFLHVLAHGYDAQWCQIKWIPFFRFSRSLVHPPVINRERMLSSNQVWKQMSMTWSPAVSSLFVNCRHKWRKQPFLPRRTLNLVDDGFIDSTYDLENVYKVKFASTADLRTRRVVQNAETIRQPWKLVASSRYIAEIQR